MEFLDWENISSFEKAYWIMALVSSLIFLGLSVMTFIGGDGDGDGGDADADVDADAGIGFQFLTVKNLTGFFTIFAWTGISCIDSGLGVGMTVFISVLAGLAMMTVMASIFYLMSKLTGSGTLVMNNAIGRMGEVYLVIPPSRSGYGKVQIKVQGSLRELEAITDDESELKNNSLVTVQDVIDDSILLVARSGKAPTPSQPELGKA
jgi:hypothetical protein